MRAADPQALVAPIPKATESSCGSPPDRQVLVAMM